MPKLSRKHMARAHIPERNRVLNAIKQKKEVLVQCRTCRKHKHYTKFKYHNWDWNLCEKCKRPKKPAAKHRLKPDDDYLDAHLKEMSEFLGINLLKNYNNV
jgi:hypothetical protein